MSRRNSQLLHTRNQPDALNELENFRKKILHVNRQITKHNSVLSVHIEELNTQKSALMAQNIELRSKSITLQIRLRHEQENSRRILSEVEAMAAGFMKNLGLIRSTMSTSNPTGSPPKPPARKAQRPIRDASAPPPLNCLARPPNFDRILEEDENNDRLSTPNNAKKPRHSSPISLLPLHPPLPALVLDDADQPVDAAPQSLRKSSSRRVSGLITPLTTSNSNFTTSSQQKAFLLPRDGDFRPERASSPAEATFEYKGLTNPMDINPPVVVGTAKKPRSKRTSDMASDTPSDDLNSDKVTKRRARTPSVADDDAPDAATLTLMDVTNSPRRKLAAQDAKKSASVYRNRLGSDHELDPVALSTRTPGVTEVISQYHTPPSSNSSPQSDVLNKERIDDGDENLLEDDAANGRERRTRKSVNYAEPKLNTKMRKPREEGSTKRRSSATPRPRSQEKAPWAKDLELPEDDGNEMDAQQSPTPPSPPRDNTTEQGDDWQPTAVKRKRSSTSSNRVHRVAVLPNSETNDSDGTQADHEYSAVTIRRRNSHTSQASSSSRIYD